MKIFTTLSLMLLVLVAFAQEKPAKKRFFKRQKTAKVQTPPVQPAEPFADFQFDEEVHNFGNLPNGPDASFEFRFKNIGNQPLIITAVQPGCGCTAPEFSKEPLPPGKSGVIKVVYHTSGRPGDFYKPLTILSNARSAPKIIYIQGKVAN